MNSSKSAAADTAAWRRIVSRYQYSSVRHSLWQLANTLIPYVLLWWLMYLVMDISLWWTLPLAVLAGALLVRIFIILHDCGHGSYFRSRRANDVVGFIAGILTFCPYQHWRWEHAIHHAGSGDLDKRGTGDIWTMTVAEYLAASPRRRFHYRMVRNPFVLFVVAPFFVFVVKQRFASSEARGMQYRSVWWTNLALLCMGAALSWIFGFWTYVLIQSVAITVAGAAGLWLFYVQHQFEGAYWERSEKWDYAAAALQGSSFYRLPRVLQWFSGNIGFHHIHHLSTRIPNYNLQRCHESDRLFDQVKTITLLNSLQSLPFRLWDEDGKRLVGFPNLRSIPAVAERSA